MMDEDEISGVVRECAAVKRSDAFRGAIRRMRGIPGLCASGYMRYYR
ncbi:MAG: hypothetical protein ACOY30_00270 [Bacillota bacterium]